ncbi:MAG: hypothetical protein RL338_1814 [Chloroflexota bacterium]
MFGSEVMGHGRQGRTLRRSLVVLAIAALLAGFGVVVPAMRDTALAVVTFHSVAATGAASGTPDGTCANPDFGPDDHATGSEGAIEAAIGAAVAGDVILLCPGTHSLTTGDVTVATNDLTFEGGDSASSGDTIVEATGSWRLFDAGSVADVAFSSLTLRNGNVVGGGSGGAILARAVSLDGVTVRNNQADQGGAVYATGTVSIVGSTFQGNTTPNNGGALYLYYASGDITATVENSTFVDNTASTGAGGGVGGSLLVFADDGSATLSLKNTTFVGSTGFAGYGKHVGVASEGTGEIATLDVYDSIFVGGSCWVNGDTMLTNNNRGNFRDTAPQCPGTSATSGDLNLGALADNGGPTETIALLTGSVAIDAVAGPCPTTTDQRGQPRPYSGTDCDSGAFEFDPRLFVLPTTAPTWTYCPSPYATIQAAVTAATTGDTIHLCAGSHDLTSGVVIPMALTVEGDGSANTVVGPGAGTFRLIDATGYTIVLRDLEMTGGSVVGEHGGAVRAAGVDVLRARFSGNQADGGGAIHSDGPVSVTDATFTDNTANTGDGGAIDATGGTVAVTNSTFVRNVAVASGGAIAAGNVSSDPTLFADNTAATGGAIWAAGSVTTIGDTFLRNSATGAGGGGAIYANLDVTVSDGTFTENTAFTGPGGAIVASADSVVDADVIVTGTDFTDNSAATTGGAIHSDAAAGPGGVVDVSGGSFSGNRAGGDGGAINLDGAAVVVVGVQFSANVSGDDGGAVRTNGNVVSDGSDFDLNVAVDDGGAIQTGLGQASITDGVFIGNSAYYGGAIQTELGQVSVTDGVFIGNSAEYGGAIYAEGPIDVETSTFEGNSSNDHGGAIDANDGAAVFRDSTFSDNTAGTDGGAIHLHTDAASLTVVGGGFISNDSVNDGGAIYADDEVDVEISGATFTSNSSGDDGGAIYAADDLELVIRGSTFTSNSSGDDGGALYADDDDAVEVSGATFTSNSSGDDGGALYADLSTDVEIFGTTFASNSAGGDAGAIRMNTGSLSITDGTFTGNSAAVDGGAVRSASNVTTDPSTYVDNTAGVSGGAIYALGTVTTIGDTFERNTALTGQGGAIYAEGFVAVTDGTFTANSGAVGAGGAIFVKDDISIDGSTFDRNSSPDNAGAVYSRAIDSDNATMTVTNSTFVDNSAGVTGFSGAVGGSLLVFAPGGNATMELTNTTFVGSTTFTGVGGHVGVMAGSTFSATLDVTDSVFSGGSCYTQVGGTPGAGTVNDNGENFQTDGTCPGDLVTASDLDLQPLADNGGPTETVALGAASVALDASASPCVLAVDQRGIARPQGGGCDSGAYEANNFTTITTQASSSSGDLTNGLPRVSVGDLVTDVATVAGTLPASPSGLIDPTTGSVEFFVCRSAVAQLTECSSGTPWTSLGTDATMEDGTPGDGEATAGITFTPTEPGWYLISAVYDSAGGPYFGSETTGEFVTESVFVAWPTTTATQAYTDASLTTPISAGVPMVTTGDTIVDIATITGSASDGISTYEDPTGGTVRFYYCHSLTTGPNTLTDCTSGVGTALGGPQTPTAATPGIGESTAGVSFSPPTYGWYLLSAYYEQTTGTYEGSSTTGDVLNELVYVRPSVNVYYNGPWRVSSSSPLSSVTIAAVVTPQVAGCEVEFTVGGGDNPPSPTTYSATTGSNGVASVAVTATGGVYGIYEVDVEVLDTTCYPLNTDRGSLAVLPGSVANGSVGGGWTRTDGTRANFGHAVVVSTIVKGKVTTTMTKGSLLWSTSQYRLKASMSTSTTDGSTPWIRYPSPSCPVGVGTATSNPLCGEFSGYAKLQEWSSGSSMWVDSTFGTVWYTARVYDGGLVKTCTAKGKTCKVTEVTDWFGISFRKAPGGALLPMSYAPVAMNKSTGNGSITNGTTSTK